ncbi:hypothetical protein HNY73_006885 [Argiope bruennichi]|uniref:Uncharacterized protein n=1 Tax=Argiope bruennichi TaxID=94029 RepID=A0A8T0FEZ5_ARGBR|nr:hypothetical protein HNY73_006885 [Argiope bruennichi]
MDRKRPSSSKSSKKQHSSKQNAEETTRKTRSMSGKNYKRLIYNEDSSSDEMVNADWSRFENDHCPSTSKAGNSNEKNQDDSSDESLEDISFSDSDSTASEKRFKKETNSATFPSSSDLADSRSSSPFLFWGKNAIKPNEPLKCSERGLVHDDMEDVDGATAPSTSKDIDKEIRSKDWEKWRIKAAQQKLVERIKKLKRSKRNAVKKPRDEDSNENLLDAKSPPVTAEHEGIP